MRTARPRTERLPDRMASFGRARVALLGRARGGLAWPYSAHSAEWIRWPRLAELSVALIGRAVTELLGDETRAAILSVLSEGPSTIRELVNRAGRTRSSIRHQLDVLQRAQVVAADRSLRPAKWKLGPAARVIRVRGRLHLRVRISGRCVEVPL